MSYEFTLNDRYSIRSLDYLAASTYKLELTTEDSRAEFQKSEDDYLVALRERYENISTRRQEIGRRPDDVNENSAGGERVLY